MLVEAMVVVHSFALLQWWVPTYVGCILAHRAYGFLFGRGCVYGLCLFNDALKITAVCVPIVQFQALLLFVWVLIEVIDLDWDTAFDPMDGIASPVVQ